MAAFQAAIEGLEGALRMEGVPTADARAVVADLQQRIADRKALLDDYCAASPQGEAVREAFDACTASETCEAFTACALEV